MFTHLRHGVLHNLLVRHITLVAHEQLVHTLRSVAVDLLQPLLDVVEAVHVRDIVDDANAVSAAVVGGCYRAEAFLAGRVPLQPLLAPLGNVSGIDLGRTICSFTVLPSSSIVRIFCPNVSLLCYHTKLWSTYEVDADSGDVALSVRIVCEPQEQARLSHTRVTDEEELEEVIVSGSAID